MEFLREKIAEQLAGANEEDLRIIYQFVIHLLQP